MIGHKGHKEAKTRLCTLSCRLYRYLLDCKVGLLTCVHCKSVMYRALGKLGVHQAWKFWCTIELIHSSNCSNPPDKKLANPTSGHCSAVVHLTTGCQGMHRAWSTTDLQCTKSKATLRHFLQSMG